jgi:integrase
MPRKRSLSRNSYLQKRRQGWYVRVAVPQGLVPVIRKRHIVRSLQTRDVEVARKRRWPALAQIQTELADQAGREDDPFWTPPWQNVDPVSEGLTAREDWLAADDQIRDSNTRYTEREELEHVFHDWAEEIEKKQGPDAAKAFWQIATSRTPMLRIVAEQWLADIRGTILEQTLGQHRFAVQLFLQQNPKVRFVGDADRRRAGRFVSTIKSDRSQKTVNRIVSSLSACWKWMKRRGLAESNPWEGQGEYRRRNKGKPKRPFDKDELLKLLSTDPATAVGPRYGPAIQDLVRLGLMTGARLNELCALAVADVEDRHAVRIGESKTEAGKRVIPVHDVVWPIVQRRREEAVRAGSNQPQAPLFPELPPQGPDRKRSWYLSKKFTVFRRRVLGADNTVDFHSLRRTFATYLEQAQRQSLDVNPGIIAELMGHEKGTLALSLYSGGYRIEHLQAAIGVLGETIEPQVLNALRTKDLIA